MGYGLATEADLAETVKLVEEMDRHIIPTQADVRDSAALRAALAEGVAALGRVDIVVANAGILSASSSATMAESTWRDMLDVNLTGVYHTAQAAIPHPIAGGRGGAMVLTSSAPRHPRHAQPLALRRGQGRRHRPDAFPRPQLASHRVRVNTVNPSVADTDMVHNSATYGLFMPHLENPTRDQASEVFATLNPLPPWVESADVTNAVMFLVSDEGRYITGLELKIDADFCLV